MVRVSVGVRCFSLTDGSGGVVADGVRWPDGSVSVRWRGVDPWTSSWSSAGAVERFHAGVAVVVWETQSVADDGLRALGALLETVPWVLTERRRSLGLTQRDVASRMGVSPSTVHRAETGALPSGSTLVRMLRWLDVTGPSASPERVVSAGAPVGQDGSDGTDDARHVPMVDGVSPGPVPGR